MKKFIKLLKDKKWRWTAGGGMCLVLAVFIFVLSSEVGVEAIYLGGEDVSLNTVSGDVYLIETPDQLIKLGNASSEETINKRFRLANDIIVESTTSPAIGTFSGAFDGDGHVITYEKIEISGQSGNTKTAHGLLFGVVDGQVSNLILDIQDDSANYTRELQGEIIQDGEMEEAVEGTAATPLTNDEMIHQLPNIVEENGDVYKYHTLEETMVQTTSYKDNAFAECYFGLICGDNQGTIEKVYVSGDAVLSVERTGSAASGYKTVEEYGKRDVTYHYKQVKTETEDSALKEQLSITVNSYGQKTYVNEDTQNEIKVTVSVPTAIGNSATIPYTIKVENKGGKDFKNVEVSLGVDSIKESLGTIPSGSSIDKTLDKIPGSLSGIVNVTGEVASTDENGNPSTEVLNLSITDIQTDTFVKNNEPDIKIFANGLKATLAVDDTKKYQEPYDFKYQLILENTNSKSFSSSKDIVIKSLLTDWFVSSDETSDISKWNSENIIPAECRVVLTKTVTVPFDNDTKIGSYVEKLDIDAALKVAAYTYEHIADKNVIGQFVAGDDDPVYGETLQSGGTLYAGVIAGVSSGRIAETKTTLDMSKNAEEKLSLGGIAGKAVEVDKWSDLYMLGKVDGESVYASNVVVAPQNSYTTPQLSVSGEKWSVYEIPSQSAEDVIDSTIASDLAWLIIEDAFEYNTPDDTGKIAVELKNKKTSKEDLEYAFSYRGRKSMKDKKVDNDYFSDTNEIDLGKSGYYTLLGAYATDGYYHYKTSIAQEPERKYPYDNDVWSLSVKDAEVVRTQNPVKDHMKLTLSQENVSGMIHYHMNDEVTIPYIGEGSHTDSISFTSGNVILPFDMDVSKVKYHMVPEINEHIYPPILSDEYSEELKTPLGKPMVKAYNYYNSVGVKQEYAELVENISYVAGRDMEIIPEDDDVNNYTIRYLYSTTAPVDGEWEESRYLKGSESFDALFDAGAMEYLDSATVPTELLGDGEITEDVYFYVEISKKFYSPQIYCYGPFDIVKEDQLTVAVPDEDGYTVINGDVATITGPEKQDAHIQYFISKEVISNYSNVIWNNYLPDFGITMNQSSGGHIYARIAYGSKNGCEINASKYSEVYHFQCTFGGVCDAPRITPYTGNAGNDIAVNEAVASLINSSTSVMLSSRTENAEIFYLVSDNKKTITFSRVTNLPKDNLQDGEEYQDKKYFETGNRWYSTTDLEVERYQGSIYLVNETDKEKVKYISAIGIAEGYELSECVSFVYKVAPATPVENPEATIETRYMPDGESIEMATVTNGASISFYTVTPGAEIYYVTGSSTAIPDTLLTKEGVVVTGEYDRDFIVRVQAKKENMLDSDTITFVYHIAEQERVNAPTATPGTSPDVPTTVLPGNKILLSTTSKEASIYYTTDGTSPVVMENEDGTFTIGNESTKLYDSTRGIEMPMDGSGYFSITAIAVKQGYAQSTEAHFTYSYPDAVLPPYANLDSGKVELNANVFLKNLTEGASIYYTVAYGDNVPDAPTLSSSVFSEEYPFVITQKTSIKAMAAKDGVKSSIVSFAFDPMEQLKAPNASIESGSVVARGTILELTAAKGSTIYYTMDGSDPTDSTNTAVMAGNSLILNGAEGEQITIKAYAAGENKSNSEVVTFTYLFSQNTGGVTASIETGSTVPNGTKVNLISDVTEGDIYYTTDGSSPVSNGKKGTTVEISGTPGMTFTVKAVVMVNGDPGTIATFIYKIQDRPDAPTASPAGGALTVATRVSLNAGTEKIYYTTDGTEPTKSSALYSEPILINRATTLKAIAVSEEGEISQVATFVYTAAAKAASVVSNKTDGSVLEPGDTIRLTTTTDGATIYYSTDGTEPTLDNLDSMLIYDGDFIEINRGVTIQAVAYREDLRLSDVKIWNYLVDTIPAVEQKKAEAEKLAEEGLKDTDASELKRDNNKKDADVVTKTVREKEYQTAVIYPSNALDGRIVLETVKEDDNPYTVKKAKGIYGDDTTVLVSYEVKLKSGSSAIQPKEMVEVALPIPKGYEDAALSVALVKDDYNLNTLETRREADILYVKTQKLGSYVIIGPERTSLLDGKFPYLLLLEGIAGIALTSGIVFYAVEKYKKVKKNK